MLLLLVDLADEGSGSSFLSSSWPATGQRTWDGLFTTPFVPGFQREGMTGKLRIPPYEDDGVIWAHNEDASLLLSRKSTAKI